MLATFGDGSGRETDDKTRPLATDITPKGSDIMEGWSHRWYEEKSNSVKIWHVVIIIITDRIRIE